MLAGKQVKRLPDGYACRVVVEHDGRVKIYDSHKQKAFWISMNTFNKHWKVFE